MAMDAAGNDLSAVGIPITGFLAVCFDVTQENVMADEKFAAATLELDTEKWHYAGLFKDDGGIEPGSEAEDAIEFFQQGYQLNGLRTDTIKVGLAEDNETVRRLVKGQEPNANGVIYVDSSNPDQTFLALSMTQFKNGTQERRHGLARVSEIEIDKEERGSVRAKTVTIQWVPSPLFNGSPYKEWFGTPGSVSTVARSALTTGTSK